MTRQRLVSIALVAFGLVAAVVVTVVVVRGIGAIRRDRLLEYTFRQVDSRVGDREWEAAAQLLDDFAGVNLNAEQWRQVLRRAWVVTENTTDWAGFRRLAAGAAGQHPRNAELGVLDIYARHRAGNLVSHTAVPAGARFDALRGTLFLRTRTAGGPTATARADAAGTGDKDVRDRGEISIADDSVRPLLDAALVPSAENLGAAYEASRDPRFAVDAALVHLRAGRTARAREETALRREGVSPRFRAKVALSAADFAGAAELLSDVEPSPDADPSQSDAPPGGATDMEASGRDTGEDVRLLRGDALIGLGDPGGAERLYRQVPRSDWTPEAFQNVAHILRGRGGEPEVILRGGVSQWPEDPELARALAVEVIDERPEEARGVFDRFAGEVPRVRLTSMLLFEELKTPQRVRGTLWTMYKEAIRGSAPGGSSARGSARDGEVVGAYLAWYLAGIGDWDDLTRLVSDNAAEWARFYQGILAVRSGRPEEALSAFAETDAAGVRVAAGYNEGRIALALGELDRAESALTDARETLARRSRDGDRDRASSQVLLELGRLHLLKGREETGYRMLSQALGYNPGNATARNLLEEGSFSGTPRGEGTTNDTTQESQAD